MKTMDLQKQIEEKSKNIHVERYDLSIGEVVSMYKESEIDIHPEFQRFFRWEPLQKTKLIESLLLGIPIPPIFVSQRVDGIWDVVDGVQRLSTIFQFIGILKDEKKEIVEPLKLMGTNYLPALEGVVWDDSNKQISFTDAQQRYLKRAKLSFIIILKESDKTSKYDLFQRLNSGTVINPQEIRNCILVMENKEIFKQLNELAKDENFQLCAALSEDNIKEQYDMELLVRFIVLRSISEDELKKMRDLSEFLNDKIVEFIHQKRFDLEKEKNAFKQTFEILAKSTKEKSFQKYYSDKHRFSGGFLVSAFEIVALGIGQNPIKLSGKEDSIKNLIIKVWEEIQKQGIKWSGYSAAGRLPKTIKLGRKIFQQ